MPTVYRHKVTAQTPSVRNADTTAQIEEEPYMSDMEELKENKTAEEPKGLRKLAPEDFDEEMAAIRSGLSKVAKKFKKSTAADGPIPVDQLTKGSLKTGLSTIASMIKAAASTASEKKDKPKPTLKSIEFQEDEPEEPLPIEENEAAVGKGKELLSKAAQATKGAVKAGVDKVTSEKSKAMGRAAADVTTSGFGDAAAGVAEAFRDIKNSIGKKSPRAAAALSKIGNAAAGTAGAAGNAAKLVGRGIKAAGQATREMAQGIKESGAVDNAKEKLGEAAGDAAKGCSEKLKKTGAGLTSAAGSVANGFKKASLTLEKNFVGLQKAAIKKAEEHIIKKNEGAEDSKLSGLSEKAAEGFGALCDKIGGKGKKIANRAYSYINKAAEKAADGGVRALRDAAGKKVKDVSAAAGNVASKARKKVGDKDTVDALEEAANETLKKFTSGISNAARAIAGKTREKVSSEEAAEMKDAAGEKLKKFTSSVSGAARTIADKARETVSSTGTSELKGAAGEKLKKFTVGVSGTAKILADKAREKAEQFYGGDETGTAPTTGEKLNALKDIASRRVQNFTAAAKEKIEEIYTEAEKPSVLAEKPAAPGKDQKGSETPEFSPRIEEDETPSSMKADDLPEYTPEIEEDDDAPYIMQGSVDAEALRKVLNSFKKDKNNL